MYACLVERPENVQSRQVNIGQPSTALWILHARHLFNRGCLLPMDVLGMSNSLG
jgi:hypothetical protein